MSEVSPNIQFIAGKGKPRLIVIWSRPYGAIVSSSVANPTVITTALPHKLVNGMTVRIAGHTGSTPAVDGDRLISNVTEKTFTVPVNVTVAGTGGTFEALTAQYESTGTTTYTATTANETGSPTFANVLAGHRISSFRTVSGLDYPTYGKVTAKATGVLTVSEWNNGTPTGGKAFQIDGWVTDLPRCQEMTEIYEPDVLVHSLYAGDEGSREDTEMRGWKYWCVLDYSKYASADLLLSLRAQLNARGADQLVLIPRIDAPQFQYNVYFSDKFELSRFGISVGYRKPIFTLKSKENLAGILMISGYGTGYATLYGTNL